MASATSQQDGDGRFATTRWTMVVAAGAGSPGTNVALAELCRAYWMPLYAFLRCKGHQPSEAEDLVQAFFTSLIEKAGLAAVDPHRGRFRSFLVGSLQNFVANRREFESALKRGGQVRLFDLDFARAEEVYHREPATDLTPEKIFDRRWAIDLLNRVFDKTRADYANSGKASLFDALSPRLNGAADAADYSQIASSLGMTADAVKMALTRLRKQYRQILRQTIADTVASPDEVDDELRYLFQALSN